MDNLFLRGCSINSKAEFNIKILFQQAELEKKLIEKEDLYMKAKDKNIESTKEIDKLKSIGIRHEKQIHKLNQRNNAEVIITGYLL